MDYKLAKINRDNTWDGVFKQIDDNFQLVVDMIKSATNNSTTIEKLSFSEGQSRFTLSTNYTRGMNHLMIYRNNVLQWLGEDFFETSDRGFELAEPMHDYETLVAVYHNARIANNFSNSKGINLDYDSNPDLNNADYLAVDKLIAASSTRLRNSPVSNIAIFVNNIALSDSVTKQELNTVDGHLYTRLATVSNSGVSFTNWIRAY